ncbi:subtilisin-like protein [Basidiobolus meristosporus CBS 931.73]|uniref:Subtilisin-like protein n=1 Tax=Basidiobolus meristosporus CBS 931.73 TaxID=1314790 RepID=A0A1Y1Y8S7_9FUNG|nr:subtilisin-like protein [Basidiobolus meristosporus CBS 931.73]|eukprot:ORX94412.1 subtilisin-like protein [Basidiobolus meristosporus CBS 931.73]
MAEYALGSRPTGVLKSVPADFGDKSTSVLSHAYIVEFDQDSKGVSKEKLIANLKEQGIEFKERASFSASFNGVSLNIDSQHADFLASVEGVKAVWPITQHKRSAAIDQSKIVGSGSLPSNLIASPHVMTGVDKVHEQLKNVGTGIRVGVIDTGIDYTHPALGGCFGKNCRVQFGYDYVGDAYNGDDSTIHGDNDPKDCQGHGTHVAGIIGARDKNFVGVAPDVTFGAYKVFGCDGGAPSDMIIKAIEQSVVDKMNVINLSLGSSLPYPDDPMTRALNKAADAGVIPVVAAGNEGMSGLWTVGRPSTAVKAIGVASFDNIKYPGQAFTINQDKGKKFVAGYEGLKAVTFKNTPFAIAQTGGCSPLKEDLTGKVVLFFKPESCDLTVKGVNAQKAGAVGAFVYSSTFGAYVATTMDPSLKIPLMGLQASDAAYLNDLYTKNKDLTITFDTVHKLYDNPNGGKPSSFTSWGPDFELNTKPDVGAPGGIIYSTFPVALGSYAHLRGTSMASPYTAGSVALILKSRGILEPSAVNSILQHTAQPVTELNFKGLTSAGKQGAGLINVWDAIHTTSFVSPSKFALNDTTHFNGAHTFTVSNKGKKTVTYIVEHTPAISVNGYDKKGYPALQNAFVLSGAGAAAKAYPSAVTVRPGQSKTVKVTFTAPRLDKKDLWVYSGYVNFRPLGSKANTVRVPYTGVSGDLHSVKVIDINGERQPTIVSLATGAPAKEFNLATGNVPLISFPLIHATKYLSIAVADAKGAEIGLIGLVEGGFPRNTPGTAVRVTFDGSVTVVKDGKAQDVQVPSGTYTIVVKGLKPFGSSSNQADFDTWVSAPFSFKRDN